MLIIRNAREVATCRTSSSLPAVGKAFSDCGIVKNATVVIDRNVIRDVGNARTLFLKWKPDANDRIIDATGMIVVPGFVDCHTHGVFAGSRADEYEHKLAGESYADLHRKGGGIHSTVRATRRAEEGELFGRARKVLYRMLHAGTTTVEIKSGYGLTLPAELKILRVIKRLKQSEPIDIIPTFLGAHTVPHEYKNRRTAYVEKIVRDMLPAVRSEDLAEYCDVFCDPLGFTVNETRLVFRKARELGFKIRIHAEQTAHFGGARVAAEFGAESADHCDFASFEDMRFLQKKGVSAVLLPGTPFHLMEWDKKQMTDVLERAKKAMTPVALATDFNPGSSPVSSMKVVMDLALRFFRMSYAECLNATTINAAYALGRAARIGSIQKGKNADVLVIDAPTVRDYMHAVGDAPIQHIIKNGRELLRI